MSLGVYSTIIKCGDNRGTRECLLRRGHKQSMQVSFTYEPSCIHDEIRLVSELCPWDRPVATLQTFGNPLSLAFHAYDPHLVVANESDMIRSVSPY